MTGRPKDVPSQRPRFVAPRQAPRGLWRRTPPMIFAPILGLLALALAWRFGIDGFALPRGLADFLSGVAAALFLFAALAYLAKLVRRPAAICDELSVLPGRVGIGAGVIALYLFGGLVAVYSPAMGRLALILGLLAQMGLIGADLWLRRGREPKADDLGPDMQLRWSGLLVGAAMAPVVGWPALGWALIWPGAVMALVIAGASLIQLRRRRVPAVLLPLLALHLVPVAGYGLAAVHLGAPFQQTAFGLVLAGLLVLPVLVIRAGTGLFLSAITMPLGLSALFLSILGAAYPDPHWLGLLAGLVLTLATLVCLPVTFLTMRDWARGRLAQQSNAAIA